MKKNDITYEYRVFTNRLIDVDSMEVGNCTSKVIKEIKSKDKVDGRFFHTSDTDEWFYCWNGELQKLNLKGDSDVNAALAEVKKLIGEANAAVSEAKNIASEAKDAADAATKAAEDANAAVESIENKADKSEVDAVSKAVEAKAEKAVVDELVQTVADKAEQSVVEELSAKVDAIPSVKEIALKSDLDGYVKSEDMPTVPSIEGLATETYVDEKVAEIKVPSIEGLATKEEMEGVKAWVNEQGFLKHQDISGKQDVISDLETIRTGAAAGATALQKGDLEGYVTSENVYTKAEIDALIGVAKSYIKDTILA